MRVGIVVEFGDSTYVLALAYVAMTFRVVGNPSMVHRKLLAGIRFPGAA